MRNDSTIRLFGITLFDMWSAKARKTWCGGIALLGVTYKWSRLYHSVSIGNFEYKFFKNKAVWPKK